MSVVEKGKRPGTAVDRRSAKNAAGERATMRTAECCQSTKQLEKIIVYVIKH